MSLIKKKKLYPNIKKIDNEIIENYKIMTENLHFEQNSHSRTAEGINKIGNNSYRVMKWMA